MFYKTQREIAEVINKIVDGYWDDNISEDEMIDKIKSIYVNNPSKLIKENDFTTILKQQCGKRRLEVVNKILSIEEDR